MLDLFYSLYRSMFIGNWEFRNINLIRTDIRDGLNFVGTFLTSIFNDVSTPYTTLGNDLTINIIINLMAFVLALITSIGIVVVAVKGIKRLFTVFFYGVR